MTFKAVCAKCGKEIELQDNLKNYITEKPEAARCIDCYKAEAKAKAQAKQQTQKTNTTSKVAGSTEAELTETTPEEYAKKIRKAYDCIIAEFSDIISDVKDYIGGWTSTIVINQEKKFYTPKKK